MYAGVRIVEYTRGGEPLGTVTGDCIAMIEVAILGGIELDF